MLKPADPPLRPEPDDERPIGELVQQLAEQGKSYALAELNVAKAIAAAKAQAFKVPAILLGAAFLLLQAAVTVLAVGLFLALVPRIGLLLAGIVAFLVFAGIAGALAYVAVKKIGDAA